MPRQIPDDRLERLVECATRVFIERGYRRTQMADVADALGVAKGTVYLYVESKEALFDLVCRSADGRWSGPPPQLPVPTPAAGATLAFASEEMIGGRALPALESALAGGEGGDARAELDAIVRELYRLLGSNRCGIKLIDVCSRDYPELAGLWFVRGREALLETLQLYLTERIRRGVLRPLPDVAVGARMLLETTVFWAVHRHWDPHPQTVDDQAAEDTLVAVFTNALVVEVGHD